MISSIPAKLGEYFASVEKAAKVCNGAASIEMEDFKSGFAAGSREELSRRRNAHGRYEVGIEISREHGFTGVLCGQIAMRIRGVGCKQNRPDTFTVDWPSALNC